MGRVRIELFERQVLPLEPGFWTCLDDDGRITVKAMMRSVECGHWVGLMAFDSSDDAAHDRWTQYDTEAEALEAYGRAVEIVTGAPDPLPVEWMRGRGLAE